MTISIMLKDGLGELLNLIRICAEIIVEIFELYFSSLQYTPQELLGILNLNEYDLLKLYDWYLNNVLVVMGQKLKSVFWFFIK